MAPLLIYRTTAALIAVSSSPVTCDKEEIRPHSRSSSLTGAWCKFPMYEWLGQFRTGHYGWWYWQNEIYGAICIGANCSQIQEDKRRIIGRYCKHLMDRTTSSASAQTLALRWHLCFTGWRRSHIITLYKQSKKNKVLITLVGFSNSRDFNFLYRPSKTLNIAKAIARNKMPQYRCKEMYVPSLTIIAAMQNFSSSFTL